MSTTIEKLDVQRLSPADRKVYRAARKSGSTHKGAMMYATQRVPAAKTDREFFEGRHTLDKQHGKSNVLLGHRTREAKKHGYTPNPNDVYFPSLAEFPGDPFGYVSPSGGKAELNKKLAIQKDRHLRKIEAQRKTRPRLAPDIVNRFEREYLTRDPSLAKKPRRELRDMIREKHGTSME